MGGRGAPRLRSALRLVLPALLFACAAGAPLLGTARLDPGSDLAGRPASFSVEPGRIYSDDFDLLLADGCVRGTFARRVFAMCQRSRPGETVQRWDGPPGELALEARDGALRVTGRFGDPASPRSGPVSGTVRFGSGPQWDELRRAPVLLALAAAASGLLGDVPLR